jgi:hypothetical protein
MKCCKYHTQSIVFSSDVTLSKSKYKTLFVPVTMHGKVYTIELVSLRPRALRDCVNFTNFAYWIKYHFNVGI